MIIKSFSELEKIDGELIKIPCSGLSIDKQFELVWNAYQGLLDFHGESVSRTVTVVPSECHVEFNKESKEMLPHWQDMHLTLGKHIRIALGGTFDRLHFGHKVLLTLGLMLCRESSGRLIVGVTSDEMAKERKLSSRLLEPYHLRIEKLQAFFDIFEFSEYEIIKLDDPYGPTITDSSIDALVVTDETVSTSRKSTFYQLILYINPSQ